MEIIVANPVNSSEWVVAKNRINYTANSFNFFWMWNGIRNISKLLKQMKSLVTKSSLKLAGEQRQRQIVVTLSNLGVLLFSLIIFQRPENCIPEGIKKFLVFKLFTEQVFFHREVFSQYGALFNENFGKFAKYFSISDNTAYN